MDYPALIAHNSAKGIILDTEILLAFLIGLYDPEFIARFKMTASYDANDFRKIESIFRRCAKLIVTPQILAELSNQSFDRGLYNPALKAYLGHVVTSISKASEKYVRKDLIIDHPQLPRVGFTDLSIVEAAKNLQCLVLTADVDLWAILHDAGCAPINFRHLVSEDWLPSAT